MKELFITTIMALMLFSSTLKSQSLTSGTAYPGDLHHMEGNIGIGTVTPAHLLHISSPKLPAIRIEKTPKFPGDFSRLWDFEVDYSGSLLYKYGIGLNEPETKFTFSQTGYFGIGTENPEAELHLSDSNPVLRLEKRRNTQFKCMGY